MEVERFVFICKLLDHVGLVIWSRVGGLAGGCNGWGTHSGHASGHRDRGQKRTRSAGDGCKVFGHTHWACSPGPLPRRAMAPGRVLWACTVGMLTGGP